MIHYYIYCKKKKRKKKIYLFYLIVQILSIYMFTLF